MSLRSFNPCLGFSRRTGAIAASSVLVVLGFVFMALCFAQLSAGFMVPGGVQAAFAIASIMQVILVALASMAIVASWKESPRLVHFSAYLSVTHLAVNLIVLVCLLTAVAPLVPCGIDRLPCSKLVATQPAWNVLSALNLFAQLYLSLVLFSYYIHLKDHSRRPYMPEISSRSLSAPPSHNPDQKRLLSGSEPYPTAEPDALELEPRTTVYSLSMPEPDVGYGGGRRTYEEAEQNEKERLRQEMENEGNQIVSSPIPSSPEAGILTPLGLQWRDGDLPPYAS